jgi:tellurite resistance protein TerC
MKPWQIGIVSKKIGESFIIIPKKLSFERSKSILIRMDGSKISQKLSEVLKKWRVQDVPLAKKIIVSVVGFTVLLIGIVMIITPGPALIVIPAGLTILASEYSWAKRWLAKVKNLGEKVVKKVKK